MRLALALPFMVTVLVCLYLGALIVGGHRFAIAQVKFFVSAQQIFADALQRGES